MAGTKFLHPVKSGTNDSRILLDNLALLGFG